MRPTILQRLLPPGPAPGYEALRVIAVALVQLALLTGALLIANNFVDVETVTIIYLIAVLYAATHGGIFPAIATALVALAAAAFFFYPPIYDFRVNNPTHLVDLVLFIIVAVVTGKLATDARKAKMREEADALREALIGSVSHELALASFLDHRLSVDSREIARDNLQFQGIATGARHTGGS